MTGSWRFSCRGDRLNPPGWPAQQVSLPRRMETRSGAPAAGHSAPTGPCEGRHAQERAQLARRGGLAAPGEGSGQRGPGGGGGLSDGPRGGKGRLALGARGAAGSGVEGVARSRRGRQGAPALPAGLPVSRSAGPSVCAPGRRGGAEPGEARPAHLQPPAPGKRPPGSSSWAPSPGREPRWPRGAVVGAAREARAAAAVFPVGAASKSHPQALPTLARWLPGGLRASAGGRGAGEAAPRRRKKGCPLWGWGRRGEGAAARTAPPCRQPGSRAPWPCALPAATWLRSARLQAQAGL